MPGPRGAVHDRDGCQPDGDGDHGPGAFVVRRLGTGGRITSTPPGIDCGPDCSSAMATFPFGTALTLTAQPDPASSFGGWSDPCGGPNPVCTLRLLAFSSVSATFG